jgi:hypothetical protein
MDVYKIAAKAVRLDRVDTPDEATAIEKGQQSRQHRGAAGAEREVE